MTIRNIRAMIAAFLLVLLVCFGAVMGGQGYLSAFAATDVQTAYENTNVLDNLEGSTIGGKEFDIATASTAPPCLRAWTELLRTRLSRATTHSALRACV